MSEHGNLAEARPTKPLRYTMRGDAARTVVLLYAAGDGNALHGEIAAELRPPFAGSGGGPTSEVWRAFVETLVGAWNYSGFAGDCEAAARAEGAAEAFELAARVCDERAGRWRLRAERCARSGDKMSLVHSDRMDEAESCAIDIRDRALAEKERGA